MRDSVDEVGRRARRRWLDGLALGAVMLASTGCMSSCDPAVVPMPEGYDDITFNVRTGDLVRRGASEGGKRILVWRGGIPIELTDRNKDRFRSFYEKCDDRSLCDEVSYNFEATEDDHQLTLVRFGTPLLASRAGSLEPGDEDRCDTYKALARELWDEPAEVGALDGQMEIYEINDRFWGAVLCTEYAGSHLFVGRKKRIQEMLD